MRLSFQMMTLQEFAFKDTGPVTQVVVPVCTRQTRSSTFFPAPGFYWKFKPLRRSNFLPVPFRAPQLGESIQAVQTERSHLGETRALNEN